MPSVELEQPERGRLAVQGREQRDAAREADLVVGRADRALGDEPVAEALVELGEVAAGRLARGRVRGVDDGELDHRGGEQPVDGGHRIHQGLLLPVVERGQDAGGMLVGEPLVLGALGAAGRGEGRPAHAAVGGILLDRDEPLALERLQQAGQVSRVEVEVSAQLAHLAVPVVDLVQDAGLRERAGAAEEAVVERADALGDGAVEAAHGGEGCGRRSHSLTLVRVSTRARRNAACETRRMNKRILVVVIVWSC